MPTCEGREVRWARGGHRKGLDRDEDLGTFTGSDRRRDPSALTVGMLRDILGSTRSGSTASLPKLDKSVRTASAASLVRWKSSSVECSASRTASLPRTWPKWLALVEATVLNESYGSKSWAAACFTYMVMAYIVMADIFMAYIVMAYIVMTYIVMACIVLAYIVMACIVLAYTVLA